LTDAREDEERLVQRRLAKLAARLDATAEQLATCGLRRSEYEVVVIARALRVLAEHGPRGDREQP
jgi:hypothetical protein